MLAGEVQLVGMQSHYSHVARSVFISLSGNSSLHSRASAWFAACVWQRVPQTLGVCGRGGWDPTEWRGRFPRPAGAEPLATIARPNDAGPGNHRHDDSPLHPGRCGALIRAAGLGASEVSRKPVPPHPRGLRRPRSLSLQLKTAGVRALRWSSRPGGKRRPRTDAIEQRSYCARRVDRNAGGESST
jgi:hypothetical protein